GVHSSRFFPGQSCCLENVPLSRKFSWGLSNIFSREDYTRQTDCMHVMMWRRYSYAMTQFLLS
ncbi:hypothetical protein L9F63_014710, partial [Diploptera punctata]